MVNLQSDADEIPAGYATSLFDLVDRVIVVTGAASGLGAAIATGYAQVGATVVLADKDEDGLAATRATIEAQGGRALALPFDVTRSAAVEHAAAEVVQRFGKVDALVNSAGSAYRCPAEDFPEEAFDRILELNLKGTYLCCQKFGKPMLSRGKGSIINIASIGGFNAYPLASAYLASKGGVVQVTRSFALEWRNRGVRVNGIGPTLMESPLTKAAAGVTSETADFIQSRMLRNRLGLPRELIGAAIFLASDASELVTGHTVMCDDGYLVA